MSGSDAIDLARTLIGANRPNDYVIDPVGHAEEYAGKARDLAHILSSSEVSVRAGEYKIWDGRAIEAQAEFKKWTRHANWSVFLTACVTALLLAGGSLSGKAGALATIATRAIPYLGFAGLLCGAYAGYCINRIRSGRLLEVWMENRAQAETERLEYFNAVVQGEAPGGTAGEVPPALLQLEYFRRFQLDVQLAYYKERGKQHQAAARSALGLSSGAMFVVALINGFVGLAGWASPRLVAVAALALVGQALSSKVSNTEAVNQDSRNAERYERTRSVLAKLSAKLDSVRSAVLRGKTSVLMSYVEVVHEQLSLEHRQWLEAGDERLSSIGRLEQQLEEVKEDSGA